MWGALRVILLAEKLMFGIRIADVEIHAILNFLTAKPYGIGTDYQEMRREGAAGSNAWREDRLAGVTGGTGTLCSQCFEGPLPRGHFLPGATLKLPLLPPDAT
jgi:hypothetical protein